jgi:geranylgeranyl reductase family protein
MYDVIVVGLGPAGAVTSAELARGGLSVLGLEWKPLPRYKVCGGGLSARVDPLLDSSYRCVVEDTIYSVRFQFAGVEAFQITSPEPLAYMVMRDRFDAHLINAAQSFGVEVHENERVTAVQDGGDGSKVQTSRGCYQTRILVGADGANSIVARSLFPRGYGRSTSGVEGEAVVQRRPASLDSGTIVLDIGAVKGGYAWVFPKLHNLSIGAAEFQRGGDSAKSGYDRILRQESMFTGMAPPSRRGHPMPLYGGESSEKLPRTTTRALLVGDAAHLVDPLFGEGIYYAILSARRAAKSIMDYFNGAPSALSGYDDWLAAEIYPEFRIASRVAWLLYTFPKVFHRIARRRPDIIELFYEVLKGQESYQGFYLKAKHHAARTLTMRPTA